MLQFLHLFLFFYSFSQCVFCFLYFHIECCVICHFFPLAFAHSYFIELFVFIFYFILLTICSTFSDIFDENHFITTLQGDVRIVKELPKELESAPRARKHFTSWSSMSYYLEMTELWKNHQVHWQPFLCWFGAPFVQ